jgi:hypothetical protein
MGVAIAYRHPREHRKRRDRNHARVYEAGASWFSLNPQRRNLLIGPYVCQSFFRTRLGNSSSDTFGGIPYLGKKVDGMIAVKNHLSAVVARTAFHPIGKHQRGSLVGPVDSQHVIAHVGDGVTPRRQYTVGDDEWERNVYDEIPSIGVT